MKVKLPEHLAQRLKREGFSFWFKTHRIDETAYASAYKHWVKHLPAHLAHDEAVVNCLTHPDHGKLAKSPIKRLNPLLWVIAFLLLILGVRYAYGQGKDSQIFTIGWTGNGISGTKTYAGPFKISIGSNLSGSVSGSTITLSDATVVATLNLIAQQANISSTTLYAVPIGSGGMYRASCQTVITRVATGGTVNLPEVNLNWTDLDTGVSEPTSPHTVIAMTPLGFTANILGYTSLNDTQTAIGMSPPLIGTFPPPPFFAKGGTNLTVSSTGYSGGTGTLMQYSAHCKVEYLGS